MTWSIMYFSGQSVYCSLFLLVPLLTTQTAGSRLELVSSPDTAILGLTPELKLRCSLSDDAIPATASNDGDDSSKNPSCNCNDGQDLLLQGRHQSPVESQTPTVAQVTSVLVTKLGFTIHSIASMVAGHEPVAYEDLGQQLQVHGKVAASPGEKAYLELTWIRPDLRLDGDYQCQINALDGNGRPVTFIHTLRVKVTEPNINQLFKRLWELEDANRATRSELELAKQQVSAIQSKMTSLSPPHSEDGEVTCGPSSSWSVGTNFVLVNPTRIHGFRKGLNSLQPVVFRHPYDSEPAVLISITSVNLQHAKYSSAVHNVTRFGFTIECSFWATDMNSAGHMNVKWLSTVKGMNQTGYENPWENPQDAVNLHW